MRDLRIGDPVAVEEIQWCGECISCRKGFVNHCERMGELGFTIPGAMAEYISVRERYCWKLDELVDSLGDESEALVMGAMVEPTGVSYQGMFNRTDTWLPGHHVVNIWRRADRSGGRSIGHCCRRSASDPVRPLGQPQGHRHAYGRVPCAGP